MKLRRVTAWACLGAYLSASTVALADTPAPATAAPAAGAATLGGASIADVVYLKDGSMVRGAIIELVKGQSVTLALPSGGTRQFKLEEVSYAGPFATAPQPGGAVAAPPAPAAATPAAPSAALPQTAKIHLVASEPLTFSVVTSSADASFGGGWGGSSPVLHLDHFDRLCTAPCDVALPSGRYRFAVSLDSKTIPAGEVAVAPGDTLKGQFKSYQALRIGGVVVIVASVAGSLAYGFSGGSGTHPSDEVCGATLSNADYNACLARNAQNDQNAASDTHNTTTHLLIGGAILAVGFTAGLLMLLKRDEASIEVTPGVAPSASSGAVLDPRRSALGSYDPRGLTISARF